MRALLIIFTAQHISPRKLLAFRKKTTARAEARAVGKSQEY